MPPRLLRRSVPSALTLARAALLVPLWRLAVDDRHLVAAAVVGAILGATDFLDGYAARHLRAVTTLGKVLDPTLDRIALLVSWLIALELRLFPLWLLLAIVAREVAVSVVSLVEVLGARRRHDVVWVGKAGTFGLLTAFPLALLARGLGLGILVDASELVAVVALILLIAALAHYASLLRADLGRLS